MDDDRVKNDMTVLMIYARKTRDQFHEVGVVSEKVDFRDEEMSNKKRFVILRDEETDGRKRVTTVEERIQRGGWTEIRSLTYVG